MKRITITVALFTLIFTNAQQVKKDSTNTKEIQGVTMTKKVFKKESDRFVYDVAASPIAKGNNTFDLLKQTPLVSSTDDQSLKIAGKNNAIIFINGRKSNMDAESLIQFLKNTPAENIQKIEVITSPGSEYQVDGSDGIINIVLKKKTTNGLNGNLRLGNTTNYWNSSNAAVSLNYRKDKLGINSNISTSDNIQEQKYVLRNGNSDGLNQSEGRVSDPNKNLGGYLNIDYELTEKSNLALSWNSWANRSYGSNVNMLNTFTDYKNNAKSYTTTRNTENARSYNNSVNLNYELKTDSLGSKLNLNAAYLNYKRFQNAENSTFLSNINNDMLNIDSRNIQSAPQIINNYSFLADHIQKFKNDFTVSIGGNFNKTKTDNDFSDLVYTFTKIPPDLKDNSNHFIYDENIYGFYLTLEKKFSEKLTSKLGARYEITHSVGTSDKAQNPDLKRFEQNYNNLLPYLSINYAINDKNNISYSFSSRMRRPGFWELNPVINYLTKFNYTQNNPFVKASSTYNSELTYMFKNSYFLVLNHSYLKDIITQVPLQGVINGVNQLRYIRTNFGDRQEMSATLGMQKGFFKGYFTTNFNVGVQHNRNNGSLSKDPITGDVFPLYENKINSTSFLVQTNNTIRLDKEKTWFLGVNYFYVDQQQIELGQLKNLMSLDFNIKKIWNDWTFSLDLTDVLRTNIITITDYQDNGNYNYINQDRYARSVRLNIVYNFGNKKVKKLRSIESATDEIKQRTGGGN